MATTGGPLLSVGDMLRDLSLDSSSVSSTLKSPSFAASSRGVSPGTQKLTSGFEEQGLPRAFEETYRQLELALKQSGHKWTGLTQELCAALTTADKLVATAHTELGQLSEDVKRLEGLVGRGREAVLKLQANIGQQAK